MKKIIFILSLALIMVLVGAACSSQKNGQTTDEEEGEETAVAPAGPTKAEILKLSGPEIIRLAHQLAETERVKLSAVIKYCQPGPTLTGATITGLEEKTILGVKLNMCHYQASKEAAYQTESWHDEGGAQSIIYSETLYTNNVTRNLNIFFPAAGVKCWAQNFDVTDSQLKLNCEDF